MSDLSLFRWSEFKINDGGLHNNFKVSADQFIQEAFRDSISSPRLKLNTNVVKIHWNTEKNMVQVVTESGETFTSRTVLITLSIGVLQVIGDSLFEPQLPPELISAVQSTGFGPVTKIYLEWDDPWWTEMNGGIFQGLQFVWPEEFLNCCDDEIKDLEVKDKSTTETELPLWTKGITGFDPVLDKPNVLLGWIGGDEAILVEKLEPDVVARACTKLLKKFTKLSIPQPRNNIT